MLKIYKGRCQKRIYRIGNGLKAMPFPKLEMCIFPILANPHCRSENNDYTIYITGEILVQKEIFHISDLFSHFVRRRPSSSTAGCSSSLNFASPSC